MLLQKAIFINFLSYDLFVCGDKKDQQTLIEMRYKKQHHKIPCAEPLCSPLKIGSTQIVEVNLR